MGSFIAIDVGMLNDYFGSGTRITLPEIGPGIQDALDNLVSNDGAVQAKVEVTRFGDSEFRDGRGFHTTQYGSQPFSNFEWRAAQFIFS